MSRAWFKFYGLDFRDGVRDLSLEEAGAYAILLTLIYDTGGKLEDNPRLICAHLNVEIRVWKRIRQRLLDTKKLTESDGFLSNSRADLEIAESARIADLRRTSGLSSAQVRRKFAASSPELSAQVETKSLKTKENAEANAKNRLLYARALPEADTDKAIDKSIALERASARGPRKKLRFIATENTLPAEPSATMLAHAASSGFVNGSFQRVFAAWRNFHIAKGTEIADVEASFRTWIGNETKFARTQTGTQRSPNERPRIYPNPYRG